MVLLITSENNFQFLIVLIVFEVQILEHSDVFTLACNVHPAPVNALCYAKWQLAFKMLLRFGIVDYANSAHTS